MVNPMKGVIEKFYTAFQNRDAEGMISWYHPDIIFIDPAFGELKGEEAMAMWRMLCRNAADLRVEVSAITASLKKGSAHWEAWYTFSRTGKKVHNIIEAEFEFKNSKIIKHIDTFNLHKWASQAMGWKGKLFGGTAFFKNKINQRAHKILVDFMEKGTA